jgi:DNA-binding transcriptional LysR family regulator
MMKPLVRIDLNLFVVFEVIYEQRNLTRAAEVLCLTQPAVSNALARLRRACGDPLFVATRQGMQPTPYAERLAPQVATALHALGGALAAGSAFIPHEAEQTLRISMSDLAQALLLPALTQLLAREAPSIGIESYYTPREELAREFAAGRLDLAVDVPLINDSALAHRPFVTADYVCLLRHGHPLARKKLDLDAYLALGHVHVSSRRSGGGHVDAALGKLGLQRRIQVRVPNYLVAPRIVEASDLAWSAPRALCREADGLIRELPFALKAREMHLYWPRTAEGDAANAWLREAVVRAVDRGAT